MENASKALLIAASVLIVILLIAFGMSIFNSTGDTSLDAQLTADAIASATTSAKIRAILNLIDIYDEKAFSTFIKSEYEGTQSTDKVIELMQIIMYRTQKVTKSKDVYSKAYTHITSAATSDDGTETYVVYHHYKNKYEYNCKKLEKDKYYTVRFDPYASYIYSIKVIAQ